MSELTYAERNAGIITFHKLMDFIAHPAYYKMKHVDMLLPDEDKEAFLIGTAFEDYLKFGKDEWEKKYQVMPKGKNRTVKKYRELNADGKYEITAGKGETLRSGIQDFLDQPLSNYDPNRSAIRLECEYKGVKIGGEMDELIRKPVEVNGRTYPGAVSDVKTTANLKSLRWDLLQRKEFGAQYLDQLAWYQFINQIDLLREDPDISPKDALYGAFLKVTSKEDNPMTEIFFAEPDSLLERRGTLLEHLDNLIEILSTGKWPEMSRDDLLKFNDAYPYHSARLQTEYTLI